MLFRFHLMRADTEAMGMIATKPLKREEMIELCFCITHIQWVLHLPMGIGMVLSQNRRASPKELDINDS